MESAHFYTNTDIPRLISETEGTVTLELEGGDRQRAMKRLRVPPLGEKQSPWTTFKVGLFSGSFVVLFIAVILSGQSTQFLFLYTNIKSEVGPNIHQAFKKMLFQTLGADSLNKYKVKSASKMDYKMHYFKLMFQEQIDQWNSLLKLQLLKVEKNSQITIYCPQWWVLEFFFHLRLVIHPFHSHWSWLFTNLVSGSKDFRGEHIIMLSPKFQLPDFGL